MWCPRPYRLFDCRSANIRFKYVSDWLALFMTIGVAVFGATGSIGESTLSVIEEHPDHFNLRLLVLIVLSIS